MNARTHHLRYVVLCAVVLVSLVAVASANEEAGRPLWKALGFAPLTFAGTFLFNRVQRNRERNFRRQNEDSAVPPKSEAQVADLVTIGTVTLGVFIVAIAALAPAYLSAVVWIVHALAGAAGIHAQALT